MSDAPFVSSGLGRRRWLILGVIGLAQLMVVLPSRRIFRTLTQSSAWPAGPSWPSLLAATHATATSDEKSTHLGNVPRASCLSAWISLSDHDSISWTDHDGTRSRRIGRRLDYTIIEAAAGLFARSHGTGARLRHVFSSGVHRDGRTLRTSGPASGMSHDGPGMHTAADRATLPIAGRRPISGLLPSVGHGRPRSRRHDLCCRQ